MGHLPVRQEDAVGTALWEFLPSNPAFRITPLHCRERQGRYKRGTAGWELSEPEQFHVGRGVRNPFPHWIEPEVMVAWKRRKCPRLEVNH